MVATTDLKSVSFLTVRVRIPLSLRVYNLVDRVFGYELKSRGFKSL